MEVLTHAEAEIAQTKILPNAVRHTKHCLPPPQLKPCQNYKWKIQANIKKTRTNKNKHETSKALTIAPRLQGQQIFVTRPHHRRLFCKVSTAYTQANTFSRHSKLDPTARRVSVSALHNNAPRLDSTKLHRKNK